MELRRQAEAAEAAGIEEESPKKKVKKKKAAKKRATRRVKDAIPERKRLVWVIYTATLREETRFPYDQRAEAEEKLAQLLAKGKRTYFLQPVKELVSGEASTASVVEEDDEESKKKPAKGDAEDNEEAEDKDNDDEDSDEEEEED
ncbi:MAG: hypothetical protein JKY95_04235 [Planctomycetaceae bacterium]|nr:hypothetical protein [Planctomycetaceae bacterium]